MGTRSASYDEHIGSLPSDARGKIAASVLRIALGLGTLSGAITAAVLFPGVAGIAFPVGAIVGFILGLLLGVVDAIAVNSTAKSVHAGRTTSLVAAVIAASITVFLAVATVMVATIGMYVIDDDVPNIVISLAIVVWLSATWAGNRALKSALFSSRAPASSLQPVNLSSPAPNDGPPATQPLSTTQTIPTASTTQPVQLPSESYAAPTPRLRPSHPARHRPLHSLPSSNSLPARPQS